MYQLWKKLNQQEIESRVFQALSENISYDDQDILGVPATYLDTKVFYSDASFLRDAPYISTLLKNPNHIGCHTLESSEPFFKGTQNIERELIEICAVDILDAQPNSTDGYVASGGTEANMTALWIYRNYFREVRHASTDEILLLCSTDSHYSMDKAANILHIDLQKVPVHDANRTLQEEALRQILASAISDGKKYVIVVANMMTTMYGSVDNISIYTAALEEAGVEYYIHVDGAFGGFYYPFTDAKNELSFQNKAVHSVTLDAHKMAQAPYGTGIFLIRKGWMKYANTKEASYVSGEDATLIGSRSGANAVAVWMILSKNGPYGWEEKIFVLQKRATWLCQQLADKEIAYYRHPFSNIITIEERFVPRETALEFGLVPDDHNNPSCYKIVVMDHVTIEKLMKLMRKLN